ncbi:uncharacterized protein PV09_00503 [Verruconis gallopava]|uniref:Initiation-specific alpha-1,6-mannosyltransferase n=1 Tax=Verruconis gallopava TaxID=253628 RepID=A0A0D2APX3_9PEZI|nr:uncharacterized protein PV09_00503 [Verruconis gallopava]KIW08535.1 hypothetical protein PV09_00503 [Verruconis gallopava]
MDLKRGRTPSPIPQRLPRQIQKFIPIIVACIFFVFLIPRGALPESKPIQFISQAEFPRKIWQLWKVNVLSLDARDQPRAKSWVDLNPGFRYEVLTDDNDQHYVEVVYGPDGLNRPDIVSWYRTINAKIVKADVLRYLVMYAEGGVYTDIDVEALRPVSQWIPQQYDHKNIDMVIGIEIDQPEFASHPILGKKSMSFCQWTFMAKPGHPVMLKLVENIMAWMSDVAKRQDVSIADVKLNFDDIIAGTGPSAFTEAFLEYMSSKLGYKVEWNTFHNIAESKLVAGVLVLTVEAFAAGQGHSDSGTHNTRRALVKHHYHASGWPSSHPRFSHPMYGEVERCNWNRECVEKWDADTSAFNQLSPAEQTIKLAVKMAVDEEQKQKEAALNNLNQAQGRPAEAPAAFPM